MTNQKPEPDSYIDDGENLENSEEFDISSLDGIGE